MKDVAHTAMDTLRVEGVDWGYYSLRRIEAGGRHSGLERLPFSLRIIAENLLRHADDPDVDEAMLAALARGEHGFEIPFYPARVLLQDMLGVPVMVDLAGLRDAVAEAGGDPLSVNPKIPVDFVIDHSLIADVAGSPDAAQHNTRIEFERNRERFAFLAWCQGAFRNLRVVPPDSGIVHQINVERLARVVCTADGLAWPDTMICNDSHTPMVNGIGVLGWGVGGIEAEAAMLGRPLAVQVPEVLGVRVTGRLPAGATATDLVLTITQLMRQRGVVGKFVEFHGAGLDALPVADRATIANMAPEYGATCVYFPIDAQTLGYLAFTGRDASAVGLIGAYARAQGLWRDGRTPAPRFAQELVIDLGQVERCLAGPRRPQDRVPLAEVARNFAMEMAGLSRDGRKEPSRRMPVADRAFDLGDGDVVIAAITSCTNTSNPANMVAAALLARNAARRGLKAQPWVKTSFAPGSRVVMEYLERAGLQRPLEALGFHLVGFGCTTCNGNSGPLAPAIETAIRDGELVCAAVLSGNRNFEGRVHPHARAAYLASPALVVAYAIAGTVQRDLVGEPLATDADGKPVYLHELWPDAEEIAACVGAHLTPGLYRSSYEHLFEGTAEWQALRGDTPPPRFPWRPDSTFLCRPPYFDAVTGQPGPIAPLSGMRPLAILGDTITTDHLAPAGRIPADSPAGRYLAACGLTPREFHGYGIRRGHHEVAVRGTLGAPRLRNLMAPGTEGGSTMLQPDGKVMAIYDAAQVYRERGEPLIIIAGRDYGAGSSRDWAAKGPALLGVKAVVAESFERIHRANLVGMGVLPLELQGATRVSLALDGSETFAVPGVDGTLQPRQALALHIHRADGTVDEVPVACRIDTQEELGYYRHGGILPQVYRECVAAGRDGTA